MNTTNAIPPLFINEDLQKEFDRNGFIKTNLLNADDIRILTELFHRYHKDIPENLFGSTSYMSDFNLKKEIGNEILKILEPKYKTILTNYQALGASFLYKTKGNASKLSAHQDWTIVDETKQVAVNVWLPLTDTNKENGTLHVIPKTHSRFITTLRSPTLPFFFNRFENEMARYLIPVEMKAGEAIILNESLIHYSSPNLTDNIRIAITSGVVTKGAELFFYYYDKDSGILEKYDIDNDFLISFKDFFKDIYNRPDVKLLEKRNYVPFVFQSKKKLLDFLQNQELNTELTLQERLLGIFK